MSVLKVLGLSGKLYYHPVNYQEGIQGFFLGLENIGGSLNEEITIGPYLKRIAELLRLDLEVDVTKNYHTIKVEDEVDAKRMLDMLMHGIQADGMEITTH